MTNKSVATEPAVPAIVRAIELAYEDGEELHAVAARKAAAWVERWGARFTDEAFEETLFTFERLTSEDCAMLREFRADLIERREERDAA